VTTTVPSNSVPTAPKSPIGTSQVRVTG
jgi:hypothetical protein